MSIKNIADSVKYTREFRGYTQQDIANYLGCTYQAISNYESGKNRIASDVLAKICAFYNISVESVLTAKEWEPDYIEDYMHAKSDDERRHIFEKYGISTRFICQYEALCKSNTSIVPEDPQLTEIKAIYKALSPEGKEAMWRMAKGLGSK